VGRNTRAAVAAITAFVLALLAGSDPAGAQISQGEWLAGDLHVHTCYSHDAYCGPTDDNTGPDELYTLSLSVGARFAEASARGLDYLAITDHNDVRSSADPDFGSFGVIGVPGYENSLSGHAQMLGATRIYDKGDSSAGAVNAMAGQLRADGGSLQVNHPTEGIAAAFASCTDTSLLDWDYAYDVEPDTIEIWNPTAWMQYSEAYWECWLERGAHVAATGGSDSHWLSTLAVQGVGNPTTWVFARERTRAAVLEAIGEGRTSISRLPPAEGGRPLRLEADTDRDGVWESTVGDTVPPGTEMRVLADGVPQGGRIRVRANGETLVDYTLVSPGGEVSFDAPDEPGWVRATILASTTATSDGQPCEPNGDAPVSTCAYDQLVQGQTSPIYVGG
jgi:hypothetical protein